MKNLFYILFLFLLIAGLAADTDLFAQNYALEFDGTNDAVSLSNSASFQSVSSALTIEAWVKADEFKYDDVVFMANNRYSLQFTASGAIKTGLYIGGWNEGTSNSTAKVSQWTHVALTYNGDKIHFYINGTAAGITDAANGTITAYDSSPLSIGANYDASANYFNGKIDEVRIWNIARTQTEIQDNMNKELTGNESGLVAYYKMSNGSGITLTDNSSNSNTGAISGAAWVLANDLSLPVNISSFSARYEGRSIILEWVTESETDNIGFILERSADSEAPWKIVSSYKTDDALKSRGNTSGRTKYIFTD
ncbi:LamG domain-containing protein, partial [bacterium]|nr:LamG domain-containing protein [bacterium]